ncbi:Long chronological lifespan protein 2 [Hypsizygus marmoreus]|uniref:Long chronological lifespan protein 2 n=1 Tax=Hypsizygus marmoreus TaxID=39966 RepID=A0A369JKW8_HYPMA|nr:Long chronological lifespan protein 2 [Hypsizygus marmoreus]
MSRTLALILFLAFGLVSANFEFFGNMFGGQQHQQQQQRSGSAQWAAQVEAVSCSQYLCPATLDCVASPKECPCPDAQDIKCIIPDKVGGGNEATVVCVRGENECAEVERLMRRWDKPSKTK